MKLLLTISLSLFACSGVRAVRVGQDTFSVQCAGSCYLEAEEVCRGKFQVLESETDDGGRLVRCMEH